MVWKLGKIRGRFYEVRVNTEKTFPCPEKQPEIDIIRHLKRWYYAGKAIFLGIWLHKKLTAQIVVLRNQEWLEKSQTRVLSQVAQIHLTKEFI
jgi:hypothetical protein